MKYIIEIKNLSFSYSQQPVLENIDLTVADKDFLGIIGPNGGGKTTLLKIILGLLQPDKGEISLFGEIPARARHHLGYVPQHSEMDVNYPISVRKVVAMGLLQRFRFRLKENQQAIEKAMEAVSIVDIADKPFGKLSGGQRQRCLIARALVAEPKLLLLDEPTASVDMSVEEDIFKLLQKLNEKMTIILVSHDLGFISSYVKQIACVNRNMTCHAIDQISSEKVIDETYHGNTAMIKHKCKL